MIDELVHNVSAHKKNSSGGGTYESVERTLFLRQLQDKGLISRDNLKEADSRTF